jgi:hypothetical protein
MVNVAPDLGVLLVEPQCLVLREPAGSSCFSAMQQRPRYGSIWDLQFESKIVYELYI